MIVGQRFAGHAQERMRHAAFKRGTWVERVVRDAVPDYEYGIEDPLWFQPHR